MLDTIKIESPKISDFMAREIEGMLVSRHAVDNATGQELYSLTAGTLEGSFSSSVSVRVCREEFKVFRPSDTPRWAVSEREWRRLQGLPASVEKMPCEPFLQVEGSLHKAMLGHNVEGGSDDLHACSAWFVDDLSRRCGVRLPSWDGWRTLRVDNSEVFNLGSPEACASWNRGLSQAQYPRRKVLRYGDETVMFPGTTTSFKSYHKGPEFARNGFKQIVRCFGKARAIELQEIANSLIRCETSIKGKKLKADFGEYPPVAELDDKYIQLLSEHETNRVMREGKAGMEHVRTNDAVNSRLYEVYNEGLASTLFGTWLKLAAFGEERVKAQMKTPTYYRHRKQLQEAGVSWHGSDVHVREEKCLFPESFYPRRSDPCHVSGEAPEVIRLLAPYRMAS